MTKPQTNVGAETRLQNFERILSREPFTGLRAILEALSRDREALCEAVNSTNSYEELLAKLGYRITLTKQIHVQDAFSRMGPAGGIKAVLPYFHIPAQSALPTLVNYNSTVTATAECTSFFNNMLTVFKLQLGTPN